MKFNKELNNHIQKYKNDIPNTYWFDYKFIKKHLKHIVLRFKECIENPIITEVDDCCCICLENSNVMKLFCCDNYIHHICLLECMTRVSNECPLCRNDLIHYIKSPWYLHSDNINYNIEIIKILSNIHLNIIKIEHIISSKMISKNIIQNYINANYLAIIKICKKVDKNLKLNCKQYFINIMNKNKIILYKPTKKSFCKRVLDFLILVDKK
jgi:hypothetical protein